MVALRPRRRVQDGGVEGAEGEGQEGLTPKREAKAIPLKKGQLFYKSRETLAAAGG